jgi:predicted LPLAT superfamily acyltransferase
MAEAGRSGAPRANWTSARERGSRLALRFLLSCVRTIGHGPMVVLLTPIALYFTLTAGAARRASRDYLARIRRVRGEAGSPGLLDVYRHIYSFAQDILDRLALWAGAIDDFEFELHGRENMEDLIEQGRGALLLGAHIGNFDMLRVIARDAGIPVNVVMYTANAARINEAFEELDPECRVRIIDLDPSSAKMTFEIKCCIERGEFVAVLADRLLPGARKRIAYATFLGESAPFPQNPFLLSSLLDLPVVLTIALRSGRRKYDIYIEAISAGDPVSPASRTKSVQQQIEHFAARLEHFCLQAPYQWYNFHDFWAKVDDELN